MNEVESPRAVAPGKWPDHLFEAVARETNLGPSTLDACRRVLVNGDKGVEVAQDMGLFASQISRSVSVLNRKLAELGDLTANSRGYDQAVYALQAETEVSRNLAVIKAREMVGENCLVKDAVAGETYIGKPLVKTSHHAVQSTGRDLAVIHELAKLERPPNMTFPMLEVAYPKDGKLAQVQETRPGQERGSRSR